MADDVEVLETPPRRPLGRRARLVIGLLAAACVLVAAPMVWRAVHASSDSSQLHDQDKTTSGGLSGQPPAVLHLIAPRVTGFETGFLVVRSSELVYRIRLTDGRIVATPAALSAGGGPTRLLAGRDAVALWDAGRPALVIPNDAPAGLGSIPAAVQMLAGQAGTFWVVEGQPRDTQDLTRVRADGSETGEVLWSSGGFRADGRGGVLKSDDGAIWERPAGAVGDRDWRRLTDGELTATGRNFLLFTECDSFSRCQLIRYDRATRRRTPTPGVTTRLAAGGVVSADGRYVAELGRSSTSAKGGAVSVVRVLDLGNGRTVASVVVPDRVADLSNVAVWSGAGHRLLAISDGDLVELDPTTGRSLDVGLGLGALRELSLPPG